MAFKMKKHKPLSYEEQQFVKRLLEDSKKWSKRCKGEIICKSHKSGQELVYVAKYFSQEDLEKDAQSLLELLNSSNGNWALSSAKLIGKDIEEDMPE